MKMLPVSHKLTETTQFFQDQDHSPHLWWSGCNWWLGVTGRSSKVTWGHNRIFANTSRQNGDMSAQVVPNDLSSQVALWDMHIDLLGSWPDLALTWGQVLKWTLQGKKCMCRTGLTRRTRWRLFQLFISHIKKLSMKNDLGENDNFSFDGLQSQNCWT